MVTCNVCGRRSGAGDIGPLYDSIVCYAAVDCERFSALVRALTAQAWAVACSILELAGTEDGLAIWWLPKGGAERALSSLPAPADLAAALLDAE